MKTDSDKGHLAARLLLNDVESLCNMSNAEIIQLERLVQEGILEVKDNNYVNAGGPLKGEIIFCRCKSDNYRPWAMTFDAWFDNGEYHYFDTEDFRSLKGVVQRIAATRNGFGVTAI